MTKSNLIDLEVELVVETVKAWCVDDGNKKVWIPKSQAELELKEGSRTIYILTLAEYLATEKELI